MAEVVRDIQQPEVLKALGISSTTLRKWREVGLPYVKASDKPAAPCLYCLDEVKTWAEKNGKTGPVAKQSDPNIGAKLKQAQLERTQRHSELLRIKIEVEKGKLIFRAEVEKVNVQKVLAVKGALLGLPASIAPSLVGLTAAEIQTRLDQEIALVLQGFGGAKVGDDSLV